MLHDTLVNLMSTRTLQCQSQSRSHELVTSDLRWYLKWHVVKLCQFGTGPFAKHHSAMQLVGVLTFYPLIATPFCYFMRMILAQLQTTKSPCTMGLIAVFKYFIKLHFVTSLLPRCCLPCWDTCGLRPWHEPVLLLSWQVKGFCDLSQDWAYPIHQFPPLPFLHLVS